MSKSSATAAPATIERNETLANRYDFVFLFDVTNGNPNGDPDAGNQPRMDPETGQGLVTDVCLKRKIRDYVTLRTTDSDSGETQDGYRIYIQHRGILERFHREAYEVQGLKVDEKGKKTGDNVALGRAWMCKNFFDIRTFGAVLTLEINCGQVRGPVQLTFAKSIDPIATPEHSIVRKAVAKQAEADKQIGNHGQVTGTMGNKSMVPYGLYRCHGFISASLAADTGFSEEDLALLWEAIINLFEHDRSAARGEMSSQKLIVFKHDSKLGNHPAHKLFERVQVRLKDDTKPPRAFNDYEVTVSADNLPSGVQLIEML
jgi:CRISPR-associated protein Csd2